MATERPSLDVLRTAYRDALTVLDQVSPRLESLTPQAPAEMRALLAVSRFLTLAAASTIGECRQQTPFAPLRPVIDSNGQFKWCCTHNPEHCAS